MDLHLHTPASADYREANVTYLDILKKAEEKGLDIMAFSDHNTVAGYKRYLDEVADLEFLERRNRLTDDERKQLSEFRRLQDKLLILPGFEFTATLGFHILGIFPPETSVRELEHLLLNLHVPSDRLDVGSGEVGATSDVITAYRLINEVGGMVIAAHANSSHGVAMPGFDFGGQTRISYTQDPNLHALEVTDLTSKSRRRTALFFSGTKPEYPRRMHAVQGSDAHRLNGIPGNNQELGVGDRPTEIMLDDLSFDAILNVFLGKDFSKTRPSIASAPTEFDPIYSAREEGETLVQAFHESPGKHGIDRRIVQDVVALANTNGGTIYIGASSNARQPVLGVAHLPETIRQLKTEVAKHISPQLDVQIDTLKSVGKTVLQIIVPRGSEVPYALDGTQIYVRSENETSLAVRDEIVNLVRDALAVEFAARPEPPPAALPHAAPVEPPSGEREPEAGAHKEPLAERLSTPPPHTGVEIVVSKARSRGDKQYTMRDLRNNRIIHNVTRSSARKLWQYAINEHEENPVSRADVKWLGDIGLVKTHKRAGKLRYDLVQRDAEGELHAYYGVTDDGIHGAWKDLIESLAGVAPVIEEPENGAALPEVYDMPAESEDGEPTDSEAAVEREAMGGKQDQFVAPPSAEEMRYARGFGQEPGAEQAPALRLFVPPGRNLFEPPLLPIPPEDGEAQALHTPESTATANEAVLEFETAPEIAVADTDMTLPEAMPETFGEGEALSEPRTAKRPTGDADAHPRLETGSPAAAPERDAFSPSVTMMVTDQIVLPTGMLSGTGETPTE